jgi:hypothetical protein
VKLYALVTVCAAFLAACTTSVGSTHPSTLGSAETAGVATGNGLSTALALQVLESLPVKGRAPKTGYTRDQFGGAWTDNNEDPLGHNGCDTRNDILRRDLTNTVLQVGTNDCIVLSGILADPYTGTTITFARGTKTSDDIEIDHVVALGDAWQTGGQFMTAQRRVDMANDPLNLLAVSGAQNEAKGDSDAASWLPPSKVYRCDYVARQIAVKAKYGLWVTTGERGAIATVLANCPGKTVPIG